VFLCLLTWQMKKWSQKLAIRCYRVLNGVLCSLSSGDPEAGSSFLRNVGNHRPDCPVPLFKLPQYKSLPPWKSQMGQFKCCLQFENAGWSVPQKTFKKTSVVMSCNISSVVMSCNISSVVMSCNISSVVMSCNISSVVMSCNISRCRSHSLLLFLSL
jgi:hypothetical protein